MKIVSLPLIILFSLFFSAVQCQDTTDSEINMDNAAYVEWVSNYGFRFMGATKPGEATMDASEVVDSDGIPLPESVNPSSVDLTKYDFETIVAPEKNIIIKVTENKAIFIYARKRQEILFARYLAAQSND